MFTLLKSGWSNLLRGDATTGKVGLKSNEEDFIIIPNRKRNHVGNIFNMNNGTVSKVKKEKPPSSSSDSDAASVHVRFASPVESASATTIETDVEMPVPASPAPSPPRMMRKPLLRRMMTIDMTELTLEGIPFESSTYEVEMHVREILREIPPVCPRLPDIEFDFSLEKTVLGR